MESRAQICIQERYLWDLSRISFDFWIKQRENFTKYDFCSQFIYFYIMLSLKIKIIELSNMKILCKNEGLIAQFS